MMMLNRGWGRCLWLSGTVACTVSLGSAVAQAGIVGGDRMVMNGIVGGDNLDVLGVVESTNQATASTTVSGQTVRLTTNTKITAESGGSLAKGALVAVYGAINADGTISASQVHVLSGQYVAGATTLYVRGVVKSVNPALATAKVGNLSVDFSSSLASGNSSIVAGSVAEFSGLQTSSSTLFASKSGLVKPAGIVGGDDAVKVVANGIVGGDSAAKVVANGIVGGDSAVKIVANGIVGGDSAAKVVANGIVGGDSAVKIVANGIVGGDSAAKVVANGIVGGDSAAKVVANGIVGGDSAVKVVSRLGIVGGDR